MDLQLQEKQLILGLNQKNVDALNYFFKDFFPSVVIFADKFLNDENTAKDIAQEAFLSFWIGKKSFPNIKALKGYIYTSTRNACLNHIKLHKIRAAHLQNTIKTDAFFHDLIIEEETHRLISQAIECLPSQSKKIIEFTLKGYNNPEIANELKISVNTVKTLKRNAYSKLRKLLKNHIYALTLLDILLNS